MNGFYQQVAALLRTHHFQLVRQGKGSHEIWSNGKVHVSLPTGCKSRFTANGILKDAGIRDRL